ncbi:ThiF family adenylyltransferase [Qipengyuania sp.]|uniref:HesA/MoeB/ThiF family protein n=1 Tax=Qipengyuania sp. TaxID=2004515 RepID=UPI0035C7A6D2
MALAPDRLDRFARQIIIPEIGGSGQAALLEKHIVVIGLGGIGTPALPYLAGTGIGRLTLVDDGTVEASNLHRQTIYENGDVGRSKAELAAAWVRAFDPLLDAQPKAIRVDGDSVSEAITGADLVLDGTDTFATRLIISDACVAHRIPLLSAAVGRFQGQVGAFRGHLSGEPCYRCFVGDAFDAEDCDSCAEDGMLGAMAGWVGTFAALHAIKALLNGVSDLGNPHWGQIFTLDGLAPAMRAFRLGKDPACRACGSGG